MNEMRSEGTGTNPEHTLWPHGDIEADNALAQANDLTCEKHPSMLWPHDDCPGPGMPWINSLERFTAMVEDCAAELEAVGRKEMADSYRKDIVGSDYLTRADFAEAALAKAEAENARLRAALAQSLEANRELRYDPYSRKAEELLVRSVNDPDGTAAYEERQALERVVAKALAYIEVWRDLLAVPEQMRGSVLDALTEELDTALVALDARREKP